MIKRFHHSVFLLVLGFLFFQCGESEPETDFNSILCLSNPTVSNSDCSAFTQDFCEKRELDALFLLSDEIKESLPNACMETNERLLFRDNLGNQTALVLQSKSHTISPRIVTSTLQCSDDSDEVVHFCLQSEIFSMNFDAPVLDKPISLVLSVEFSLPITEDLRPYEEIVIRTIDFSPDSSVFVEHFIYKTEETDIPLLNEEYYGVITLNDQEFTEVHSYYYPSITPNHFNRFYYSLSQGIVGFVDNDDKTWSLDD